VKAVKDPLMQNAFDMFPRRRIMSRIHIFFLGLVLLFTAACSGTNNENASTEPSEDTAAAQKSAASEESTAKSPESRKESTRTASASKRESATPPKPTYATLAAGTVIAVRLQDPLDSGVNQTGDTFRAIVDEDVRAGNSVVVPRGSEVTGKLTFVERSGRVKGRATMSMQFVELRIGSRTYPLQTEVLSFEAESTKTQDAAKVGIGSGIGAVVGAIAGGGKGAAIGAAVGAGAGGATVVATRGKELKYDVEHVFQFTLNEDLQIRIP
jgi:hypothetical protein